MFQSKRFKGKYGKGGRSAEDYGLYNLDDATLQLLASDPARYGEQSGLASKELAARRGLMAQADAYRQALARAVYGDFGQQYGAGLNQITSQLARSGPLADSGAATALRARLASQLYGQAQSKVLGGYADYLRQLQQQRMGFNYQKALLKYQRQQQGSNFGQTLAAGAGAALPALIG